MMLIRVASMKTARNWKASASMPFSIRNKVLLARIMANIRRVQMDAAEPSVSGYHCAAFILAKESVTNRNNFYLCYH